MLQIQLLKGIQWCATDYIDSFMKTFECTPSLSGPF